MKKTVLVIITMILGFSGWSQQDSIAMQYAETITKKDLKKHLTILASDAYEGRETGMPGQKKAAEYIAEHFKSLGVKPVVNGSYFQTFPLKQESSLGSTMRIGKYKYEFIEDFFFFQGFEAQSFSEEKVVFVGYGITTDSYNDYTGIDVTGKMVVLLEGEPKDANGVSMATGDTSDSDWTEDWTIKRDLAQKNGAKGVVFLKENFKQYTSRVKYWLENPGMRLDYEEQRGKNIIPAVFIKKDLGATLFGKGKVERWEKETKFNKKHKKIRTKKKLSLSLEKDRKDFQGENVLCYIEGTDPKLKDEVVVITAHYDHIGITNGEINNGADDDGSGTVTALELAQAFKKAKDEGNGTRRSILVMTVSGEEKGLLGSEWYSENPIYPLEKTVCDLNVDMIGRKDEAHKDDENYIYLIGSDKLSTDLHKISEQANRKYTNLALDYTFNAPDDPNRFYYRSDHYNFAKHGIPVIFYFSGVHEDYHRPGDDVEKILFDKMETVARLVFYTAWEVANRDEKLVVDVENDFE